MIIPPLVRRNSWGILFILTIVLFSIVSIVIVLFSYVTGVGIKYFLYAPPQNQIVSGVLRGKGMEKETMWIRAKYISHREMSYVDSSKKKNTITVLRALVTFDGSRKSIIHLLAGGVINSRNLDPYVDKKVGEMEPKKIVSERVPLPQFLKTLQTQSVFKVGIITSNPESFNPVVCTTCPLYPKVVDTQYGQVFHAFITKPGVVLNMLLIPIAFIFE